MPKAPAVPAIWILLSKGLKPQEIISLGYKEGTVYSYNSQWPAVKAKAKQDMKKFKDMKAAIITTEQTKEVAA